MTIVDLLPLLKMYEEVVLENYALRATLANLPNWDDETINANKEKYRPFVAERFSVVYRLASNPVELNAALENILRAKKPN